MVKICFTLFLIFVLVIIPFSVYSPEIASIWTSKIKVDPVFAYVVQNESGGNPRAYNPKDTDGRPKYGLLQFGWEEFYSWSPKAGIINPEIYNPNHQTIVWEWAAKNGLLRRWGSFVRLFP